MTASNITELEEDDEQVLREIFGSLKGSNMKVCTASTPEKAVVGPYLIKFSDWLEMEQNKAPNCIIGFNITDYTVEDYLHFDYDKHPNKYSPMLRLPKEHLHLYDAKRLQLSLGKNNDTRSGALFQVKYENTVEDLAKVKESCLDSTKVVFFTFTHLTMGEPPYQRTVSLHFYAVKKTEFGFAID